MRSGGFRNRLFSVKDKNSCETWTWTYHKIRNCEKRLLGIRFFFLHTNNNSLCGYYISVSSFFKCKSEWHKYKSDSYKYKSNSYKYKCGSNKSIRGCYISFRGCYKYKCGSNKSICGCYISFCGCNKSKCGSNKSICWNFNSFFAVSSFLFVGLCFLFSFAIFSLLLHFFSFGKTDA